MITPTTKEEIRQSVGSLLRGFLGKHDPSDPSYQNPLQEEAGRRGELKPFHEALLTPAIRTISKYERSFSTTLGSMFEVAAELVGRQNFAFARRQYQVEGRMGTAANATIESISNEIETTKMQGRYPAYVDAIARSFHADTVERSIKADLYIRDHDDNEMFFEMKSPKPNKSQCLDVTQKLLRIHALRQDGPPRVKTYYAMSYNPYGSRIQYKHPFAVNLLDMEHQVLLGPEFWELIGGQGTYEEVVKLFVEIGRTYRSDVLRVLVP